jgi:hypothetical protein
MSFQCHPYIIPMSFLETPWPCHKVWTKIVHRKVRLGDVTGMTTDWLFSPFDGHSEPEWSSNGEMTPGWQGWKSSQPGTFLSEWPRSDPFLSFRSQSVIFGWGWMRWLWPLSSKGFKSDWVIPPREFWLSDPATCTDSCRHSVRFGLLGI